jgi:hypothetical protein
MKMFNQGNSKPEASQKENGDMASEWEELVELDDVQLGTVVGGLMDKDELAIARWTFRFHPSLRLTQYKEPIWYWRMR